VGGSNRLVHTTEYVPYFVDRVKHLLGLKLRWAIPNNSRTATDNIFIHRNRTYTIRPIINGLSDHEAQMISVCYIMTTASAHGPQYFRNYNKCNVTRFQEWLSYEQWDNVFVKDDDSNLFNAFLNTYMIFDIYFNCKWVFTRWQWYYNKTQHTNNTHHTK
jgi:hypothetical protein